MFRGLKSSCGIFANKTVVDSKSVNATALKSWGQNVILRATKIWIPKKHLVGNTLQTVLHEKVPNSLPLFYVKFFKAFVGREDYCKIVLASAKSLQEKAMEVIKAAKLILRSLWRLFNVEEMTYEWTSRQHKRTTEIEAPTLTMNTA